MQAVFARGQRLGRVAHSTRGCCLGWHGMWGSCGAKTVWVQTRRRQRGRRRRKSGLRRPKRLLDWRDKEERRGVCAAGRLRKGTT